MKRGYDDHMEMSDYYALPNDDTILAEIREILKTADLMSVTKKSIKMELERRFGCNLDPKRAYIGSGEYSRSQHSKYLVLTKQQPPKQSCRDNCRCIGLLLGHCMKFGFSKGQHWVWSRLLGI
jgi:hypothetical protein